MQDFHLLECVTGMNSVDGSVSSRLNIRILLNTRNALQYKAEVRGNVDWASKLRVNSLRTI